MIGNWKANYSEKFHDISYSSPKYTIKIHSTILSESRHSSQYASTLTVIAKSEEITIEAFGECGEYSIEVASVEKLL